VIRVCPNIRAKCKIRREKHFCPGIIRAVDADKNVRGRQECLPHHMSAADKNDSAEKPPSEPISPPLALSKTRVGSRKTGFFSRIKNVCPTAGALTYGEYEKGWSARGFRAGEETSSEGATLHLEG
jgi:hypothetical protein